MQVFLVDDMSCGHCAAAITESILAIDAGAVVDVSLREHRVTVTATQLDTRSLTQAIRDAGYASVPVSSPVAPAAVPRQGGCCCGSTASRCGI